MQNVGIRFVAAAPFESAYKRHERFKKGSRKMSSFNPKKKHEDRRNRHEKGTDEYRSNIILVYHNYLFVSTIQIV